MNTSKHVALLLCATFLIALTSCKKDLNEATNDMLQGDWEATSVVIDGDEQLTTANIRFNLEFEADDEFTGDSTWEFIEDGDISRESLDYKVENEGSEIEFENADIRFEMDVEFDDDDEMELDGILDGERWVITLERD